jgi:hypothetical protein
MDWIFSHTCEISISKTENISELMECSLTGDSSNDSKGGSRQGKLLCLEAPQGATEQNPCSHGASETPISWGEHVPW